MWENCFYVGGSDDGVLKAGSLTAGAAVCWEFMRSQTARRLRGRVDLLVGGSAWWSVPQWPPRAITRRLEASNARTAAHIAQAMARVIGAPVVHAAHCGELACKLPWTPITYRGHYQGGAVICDAAGAVRARRDRREGPGIVVADLEPGRRPPLDRSPSGFWMHDRGAVAALLWPYQNIHGSRWYSRHARGRPAAAPLDSGSDDTARDQTQYGFLHLDAVIIARVRSLPGAMGGLAGPRPSWVGGPVSAEAVVSGRDDPEPGSATSERHTCDAEIPCFWLVICHAAANQRSAGSVSRGRTPPAVADTRRGQLPHDH